MEEYHLIKSQQAYMFEGGLRLEYDELIIPSQSIDCSSDLETIAVKADN